MTTTPTPISNTTQAKSARISVEEIAQRLNVGRLAVYSMLEQKIIPGVRVGRRWIITRYAYENWERSCGIHEKPVLHSN